MFGDHPYCTCQANVEKGDDLCFKVCLCVYVARFLVFSRFFGLVRFFSVLLGFLVCFLYFFRFPRF